MIHDRTGAVVDLDARQPGSCKCGRSGCPCIRPDCRTGWLIAIGPDGRENPDDRRACLVCKPHLGRRNTPDPEPVMSERARRAIELEENRDRYRRP